MVQNKFVSFKKREGGKKSKGGGSTPPPSISSSSISNSWPHAPYLGESSI